MALGNVNIGLANFWKVTCLDKDGNIKWEEDNNSNIAINTPFISVDNIIYTTCVISALS